MPKILFFSDMHYNNWSQFSTISIEGWDRGRRVTSSET